MEIARLVLEYLKAFLSVPVIVGGITIFFLTKFRNDVKALMGRIAIIKFPGGGELSTRQIEKSAKEPQKENIPEVKPIEKVQLPGNLSLTPEGIKKVGDLFDAERAKAYLWEYRYLNLYLVPNTQKVLDWLASLGQRTSISFFDSVWLPVIPSAEERQAIINALEAHHLISINTGLIEVTPKGQEYIQWRNQFMKLAT